jgi:outer membrane protein assembly factor BamB
MVVSTTEPGLLTAYDLDTGRRRWAYPMPEPNSSPTVPAGSDVVLLSTGRLANQFLGADGNQYLAEYYRGTLGLDLRDGRRLWQADGSELAENAGGTVLLGDFVGDGATVDGFRMVSERDGAVLWSGPPGAVTVTAAGADPRRPDHLVTIGPDGTASVYAWADGRLEARARVTWLPVVVGAGRFTEAFADGLNLYVRRSAEGVGGSLTAYGLNDLKLRWTAANVAENGARPCGLVLCVFELGSFAAYDPVTGRPIWRQVGLQGVDVAGGNTLLAQDAGPDTWAIYDALSGRVRARFGLGFLVRDSDTDEVLLTMPTVDPPRRTSVSRVDLDTGEQSLRGTVDRVGDLGCLMSDEHLICGTVASRLSVSRIAP